MKSINNIKQNGAKIFVWYLQTCRYKLMLDSMSDISLSVLLFEPQQKMDEEIICHCK